MQILALVSVLGAVQARRHDLTRLYGLGLVLLSCVLLGADTARCLVGPSR